MSRLVYVGPVGKKQTIEWFKHRREMHVNLGEVGPRPEKIYSPIMVEPCGARNCHHLLFFEKRWRGDEARLLREHEYVKVMMPVNVHDELHARMTDGIPCPGGDACRCLNQAIDSALRSGLIDLKADTPVERIEFMVKVWGEMCPETVAWLESERLLLRPFYPG